MPVACVAFQRHVCLPLLAAWGNRSHFKPDAAPRHLLLHHVACTHRF